MRCRIVRIGETMWKSRPRASALMSVPLGALIGEHVVGNEIVTTCPSPAAPPEVRAGCNRSMKTQDVVRGSQVSSCTPHCWCRTNNERSPQTRRAAPCIINLTRVLSYGCWFAWLCCRSVAAYRYSPMNHHPISTLRSLMDGSWMARERRGTRRISASETA